MLMVDPVPQSSATPEHLKPARVCGHVGQPQPHGKPSELEHAHDFPDQQARRDAQRDRRDQRGSSMWRRCRRDRVGNL